MENFSWKCCKQSRTFNSVCKPRGNVFNSRTLNLFLQLSMINTPVVRSATGGNGKLLLSVTLGCFRTGNVVIKCLEINAGVCLIFRGKDCIEVMSLSNGLFFFVIECGNYWKTIDTNKVLKNMLQLKTAHLTVNHPHPGKRPCSQQLIQQNCQSQLKEAACRTKPISHLMKVLPEITFRKKPH